MSGRLPDAMDIVIEVIIVIIYFCSSFPKLQTLLRLGVLTRCGCGAAMEFKTRRQQVFHGDFVQCSEIRIWIRVFFVAGLMDRLV